MDWGVAVSGIRGGSGSMNVVRGGVIGLECVRRRRIRRLETGAAYDTRVKSWTMYEYM